MAGEARRLNAILRAAAHATAERAGEDLLGKSQRLAPVEEGTLRGSGELDVHETADGAEAVVSFNTVYAARQHEETEWEHPKGGQAKYLEQPLRESAGTYQRLAELELRRVLS
jgi:hypothetical protein